jgi:hypothetical protein
MAQDDEFSLLLVEEVVSTPEVSAVGELTPTDGPDDANTGSLVVAPHEPVIKPKSSSPAHSKYMELIEEKVFVVLNGVAVKCPRRWIFDTRASNDLDTGLGGTVRFGDGSVL